MSLAPTTPAAPQSVAAMTQTMLDRIPTADTMSVAATLACTLQITAINDADTQALALRYAADLNGGIKSIEAHYDPWKKGAHAFHKGTVALCDGAVKPFADEIARIKGIALTFEQSERKRIAEENRIAEQKAREAQEAERKRISDEALEKANQLADAGKIQEAEDVMVQAVVDSEEVKAAPIVIAPQAPSGVKAGGAAKIKTYAYDEDPEAGGFLALVIAAAQNPDAYLPYLCINEKVTNKACNAQGLRFKLPGYVIKENENIRLGSSR